MPNHRAASFIQPAAPPSGPSVPPDVPESTEQGTFYDVEDVFHEILFWRAALVSGKRALQRSKLLKSVYNV